MSTAILVTFIRHGGSRVGKGALLTSRVLQDNTRIASTCQCSTISRRSFSSRFDPDGSGRPATWDSFGIWDNRIDEPIQLPPSIKYGKLIPHINLSKVGCSTQLGNRKENEDRLNFAKLTEDILYFAVFDGHGGPAAADFCDRFMAQYIKTLLTQEQDMEKVLTKAFLEIDRAFAREAHLSVDGLFCLTNPLGEFPICLCVRVICDRLHVVSSSRLGGPGRYNAGLQWKGRSPKFCPR